MNSIFRYILLFASPFIAISGYAEMSEVKLPTTEDYVKSLEMKRDSLSSLSVSSDEKAENDSVLFKYYYYEAARQKALGDFVAAQSFYKKCIEIDSTKSQPYAELAQYHSMAATKPNQTVTEAGLWNVSAAALMQKAVELDSSNVDNLETHAAFAVRVKDYKYAIKSLKRLLKLRPDKMHAYVELASAYQEMKRPHDALEVWNQLENVYGYTTGITNQKFAIWVNDIRDIKKGLTEFDKPIKKYPLNSSFAMNKVLAYQKVGMYKEAEKFLLKCKKKYTNDESLVNAELLTLYMRVKNPKKIESVIDVVIADKNTAFDIKGMLIDELSRDTVCQKVMTEQRYKKLIEIYPTEALTYMLYANYLSKNGRVEEAYKMVEKSLAVNPQQEYAWTLLTEYYSEKKDLVALDSTINRAVKAMPNSYEFKYRQGRWKLLNGNREGAIECFKEAVELSMDKALYVSPTNSALIACEVADVYGMMGDTVNSLEWYEKSVFIDPNCILALNNYAYMLCNLGRDLDRAEVMSAKAVQADPKSAANLDTYAWIYYKKGNYFSAQMYIEQAIKNCEVELGEIYEHYGYILYKLDEVEKAREAWKKAYDLTEVPSDELKKIVENGILPDK